MSKHCRSSTEGRMGGICKSQDLESKAKVKVAGENMPASFYVSHEYTVSLKLEELDEAV